MIKVSKLADYAVVVLTSLAHSHAENSAALSCTNALAEKTGLPEPTVAKVLKILAKENILVSVRGANGGYRLPAPPNEIQISRIITAVDGPISITECAESDEAPCVYTNRCAVKGRWNKVNQAIRGALDAITLADMIHVPTKKLENA